MAGIKIINIFKDDTFPDILELFRKSDASEVIFVLPKNGKVFRSEDHFAAFASEAATGSKTVSILCNNPQINSWARKYHFTVMASGATPVKVRKKATLASQPPPEDPDIQDTDTADAYDDSNPNVSQDETMGNQPSEDDADPLRGMHIEEEEEEGRETDREPAESDMETQADFIRAPAKPSKAAAAVAADLDYIDTMWRQKAAQPPAPPLQAEMTATRRSTPTAKRFSFIKFKNLTNPLTIGILAIAVVVLGTAIYLTTGTASIAITPVTHDLNTQTTIQTSDSFASIDSDFNKLPGQLFQVQKTASAQVPASGQRDVASKARGTITITNTYSSASQTLIATTRFTSASGLVFRSLQSVTVPGSTIKNGVILPGIVTVQVIADQPGAQYNLASTSFTIPAFKERGDMDRYAKFIGTSSAPFSGGANGPSKVVTQADYDKAKANAIAAVAQEIKDAFTQQGSGLMVVDSITPDISNIQTTAQPDDAADSVSITLTGSIKTMAFRQSDLYSLLSQAILKKEHLMVLPEKLTLTYSDVMLSADTGIMTFNVAATGTGYDPVDQQAIIHDIQGLNSSQVHDYFAQKEGIQSTTVSLSPFWVRSVPKNPNRIHLSVHEDR